MTPIRRKMLDAAKKCGIENPSSKIRRWLESSETAKKSMCPWGLDSPQKKRAPICRAMFPKISGCDNLGIPSAKTCPRAVYGLKYVIKRAREALK